MRAESPSFWVAVGSMTAARSSRSTGPSAAGASRSRPGAEPQRARPKSMTRTWPLLDTMTLSGLKSRCTRSLSCAAASPRPAAMNTSRISSQRPALGLEPVAQGVALDELHRDEHPVSERVGLVHDDDVGMGDPRRRLRFAHQAAVTGVAVGSVVGADQLDGDLAVEVRVVGRVDLTHGAASHQPQDTKRPSDEPLARVPVGATCDGNKRSDARTTCVPTSAGRAAK